MAGKPNSLTRFWHELSRRKVFRVAAMYLGTAYIIIEVLNNLSGPLHIPEWVATLVIFLLALGLPVTLILAWVFDYTPEGIKKTEKIEETTAKEVATRPARRPLRPSDIVIAVLTIVVAILALSRLFNTDSLRNLRSLNGKISVAVMPFQNMTGDTLWNVWQGGIQNELIASLTSAEELTVRQTETINSILRNTGTTSYASITPSLANALSQKLNASILVYGSINQADSTIRLNAQLINSKTGAVYRSFQLDGTYKKILHTIDSMSGKVKNALIISKLLKDSPYPNKYNLPTGSSDAYKYFLYGNDAFFKKMDYVTAIKLYTQSLSIDSNFLSPKVMISVAYYNHEKYDLAKKWCLKVYDQRNNLNLGENVHVSWLHAMLFETPMEEIKYINQTLDVDDQNPATYYELGRIYVALEQYDKAIDVMKKAIKIYNKWGTKPRWTQDYIMLGFAYQKTGQYKKEKTLYTKAEHDFPADWSLSQRQAILFLSEKDTVTANHYIDKYVSLLKDNSYSDLDIAPSLGYLYTEGGYPDKAEKCYRRALAGAPDNPSCLNNMAWFLISNNRNLDEGMALIDKALKIRPNSITYLGNKGLGLYKQGKFKEALEILEKSWSLRPVYNYEAYQFLEKVRKAAAGQK
ncbi:MAG: tetratricopeptide repeat protein [Bacteroidota bacterium]|nr:tetratricopeptide repeat protein [Bacteroidota bacterium]